MNTCIVIPVFNHGATLATVLAQLEPFGLPIILVDDGSDADTALTLQQLASEQPQRITLYTRPENGGKGAAVMDGLRQARQLGFSHALQIDADGQHRSADLPHFLDAARSNPDALITGTPQYDASVPKGRLYGRYLTHVWVWINTLSLDIRDSMCGFRVYPLAPTLAIIDRVTLGKHMEFDCEILVRLHWQNTPIINLPTAVQYPENGLSHFRLLKDNLLISKMHARLFFGMLVRLPWILRQRVLRQRRT